MFEGMYLRQGEVCCYSNQTDNTNNIDNQLDATITVY